MESRRRWHLPVLFGLSVVACVVITVAGGVASGVMAGGGASLGFTGVSEGMTATVLPLSAPAIAGGGLALGAGMAGGWALRRQRNLQRQLERLEEQLQQARTQVRALERDCTALAADGERLDGALADAIAQRDRARQDAIERQGALEAQLAQVQRRLEETQTANSNDLKAIEADVAQTWDENDRLQRRVADLEQRNGDLELELASALANLEEVWRHAPDDPGPLDEAAEDAAGQYESVTAAIAAADEDFSDILTIWDSARESAARSQFGRPTDVYLALAAIAQIGRDYFTASDRGEAMGAWRDAFRQYGMDFKPTEHQVTRSMYGQDRDFRHQGRKQRMLKHVTLGRNNTVHTLQIYFEVDRENRRIDIGYCGKHLRCYSWGS